MVFPFEFFYICNKKFAANYYLMNIQARKLVLIEEFLRISDENLITRLESFIKQEKKISYERNLQPMSVNEFHEMIDQAKRDSEEGRVTSHQELQNKVKTWK